MQKTLRWSRYCVLVALFLIGGCGGAETASSSSGGGGGGGGGEACTPVVDLPAKPQLVDWTCPADWQEEPVLQDTDFGIHICSPPPLPENCEGATMAVVGKSDCQPIGDPCPAGDWASALPSGVPIVYVKAGAAGGDGAGPDTPLGALAEALAVAPDGAIVALAKGTFVEDVLIDRPVQVWGACAEETIVEAPTPDEEEAVIKVEGQGGVTLKNLQVTGDRRGIWVAATEQPTTIDGVLVTKTVRAGVRFSTDGNGMNAGGTLRNVAVRDVRSRPSDGLGGAGLGVEYGANVTVTGSTFERNHSVGVYSIDPGTVVTLHDVAVLDTMGQEVDGQLGDGLGVQDGATVEGARCVFARNHEIGIIALSYSDLKHRSNVKLEDVVVRDTLSQSSDGDFGRGVVALDAADVTLTRALIERNREAGVAAFTSPGNPPPTLTVADIMIRGTSKPEVMSDGSHGGDGLAAQGSAALDATRAILEQNHDTGVFLSTKAVVNVSDLVIRDTQSNEVGGLWGRGLDIQNGATGTITRAWLQRNREVAVIVDNALDVCLTDITVLDTLPEEGTGAAGSGLILQRGTSVKVLRALIQGSRETGIFVIDADARIEQVLVKDTHPNSQGSFGDGVAVEASTKAPAHLTLTSARVETSARAGISNFGASLSLGTTTILGAGFDIDAEDFNGNTPTFENLGDNLCGCPEAPESCQVLKGSGLTPPTAPDPHGDSG